MTTLDNLIAELCPDGVEYKKLGEVSEICRGASPRPISQFITNETDGVNWIKIGDVEASSKYVTKATEKITAKGATKSRRVKQGDFILSNSMSFGRPYILGIDGCVHDGWIIISAFEKSFIHDFLYHLLNSNPVQAYWKQRAAAGGSIQNLNSDIVKATIMPVPPLTVQSEIARILDNFMELTAELTMELTVELTARKKQYEYYRNELLTFSDDVPMVALGSIGKNLDSKRKPVVKGLREAGEYPYYGASGIVDYVNDYIFDGDFLLVSEDGANLLARNTPIAFSASGKIWVNNHAHIMQFESYATRRYIEFYLNAMDLSKYISTAAQPKLSQENLNKIPTPLPSITEQERIVEILDRFDTLTNDITNGLPAEITARQKQYEYYRDKLLSFPVKQQSPL